ncbi:MAG: right-handed parallel beta-helix repeat-containing protein, partial [bacterium]
MKTLVKTMVVLLGILLITSGVLFAQITRPTEPVIIIGDTLYVFPTYNGEAFDVLNKWLDYGFSLDDAANDTSVKIFKLARNETYKISHTIKTTRHLHIVAEKPDLENAPPLIISATDLNNEFPTYLIQNKGPVTFKHLYFSGIDIEAPVLGEGALTTGGIEILADNVDVVIDGCYFEWFGRNGANNKGLYNNVTFTNNLGMNCTGLQAKPGVGGMFIANKKCTSRVIRNNTSINNGAWSLSVGARKDIHFGPGIIDHNTIINQVRYPFYGAMWTDAVVSNNIIYNANCWGETEEYKHGQDPDAMTFGLINIDTLTAYAGLDSIYAAFKGVNVSEAERLRKLEVLNNYYGWTDEILNYWDSVADSVDRAVWMNERTMAMFADDVNYPNLKEEGTFNRDEHGDPQFLGEWKTAAQMQDFINYMHNALREGASQPLFYPYAPVEGFPQPNPTLTWPPVFDLRVGNAALVGNDGKPLGDLNWYPEYAERWDMT